MKTIFKTELRRTRKSLVIWSAIVGLVALLGILEYPVIIQYTGEVEKALVLIPKLAQLVFGVYNVNLNEAVGYYVVMYYWTGLIVFAHAMYTGASMIAKESRDHTVEYLFTMPCTRGAVVWAKVLAGLVNIAVVGAVTIGISLLAMAPVTDDGAVFRHILVSGAGLFATQCVLMALGFLCSALFKSYRAGVLTAMGLLIACYCGLFFVQYVDRPGLAFLSPLAYFDISGVVQNGLRWLYLALAAAGAALCIVLVQRLYAKKEMGALV